MIGVGDVVVCVDASGANMLAEGRAYTVTDAMFAEPQWRDAGEFGVILAEVKSSTSSGGFYAWRFRKVQKADDKFTRQIRALRPVKQKEDA
jgi:hypothetical protein